MTSDRISVGEWTVEARANEISGPDGSKHLEPKVMQVLVYLIEHAGSVATRDEILEAIWGSRGAFSDEPLTRCIKVLRSALGDSASDPRYIRTIPKVGYELIAPVQTGDGDAEAATAAGTEAAAAPESAAASTRSQPARRMLIVAATLAVLVAVWFVLDGSREPGEDGTTPADRTAIAVLPFDTGDGGDTPDYLGTGIADEVRVLLGQIPQLKVPARLTTEHFATRDSDPESIAASLGVEYILAGRLHRDGTHTHIYVELIGVADREQIWSSRYEYESAAKNFEIQAGIANSTVEALVDKLALRGQVPRFDVIVATESAAAYDYYLRGQQYLNQRTPADLQAATEMFAAAIEADPNYGMAYVAMAYAKSLGPASIGATETAQSFDEARTILREARDKNPNIVDAALGIEAFLDLREGRLVSAYAAYRRSLERYPSEPILHHGYSLLMSTVGQHEAALEHALIARDLDPQSPIANGRVAVAMLWRDDDAQAAQYFNQSFDLGLDTVQNVEAYLVLLLRTQQFEQARALGEPLQAMLGVAMPWWDTFIDAAAGTVDREAAIRAIDASADFDAMVPIMRLGVWATLGETERALDVLARMVEDNPTGIGGFLFSAELADLRSSDRFSEFLADSPMHRFWSEYGWPAQCEAEAGSGLTCN